MEPNIDALRNAAKSYEPDLDSLRNTAKGFQDADNGTLIGDAAKALLRGTAQIPEVLAEPVQAGASYIGKAIDQTGLPRRLGIGSAQDNIDYTGGVIRDNTTRALQDYAESALPYSTKTSQAQTQLGQDIQGVIANQDLSTGEKVLEGGKAALSNWRGVLPSVVESAPQFLGGGAVLKGLDKANKLNALKSSVGLNAMLEGFGGAQGAREGIQNTDINELRKQPAFADLESKYGTEQAVKLASERAGTEAFLPSATLGGAASLVTGGGAEAGLLNKIFNRPTTNGVITPTVKGILGYTGKELAKSAAREIPEETLQGISGQLGQNIGEQQYTGVPLTQGLAEQAGLGAVSGAIGGVAYGGAGIAGNEVTGNGPLANAFRKGVPPVTNQSSNQGQTANDTTTPNVNAGQEQITGQANPVLNPYTDELDLSGQINNETSNTNTGRITDDSIRVDETTGGQGTIPGTDANEDVLGGRFGATAQGGRPTLGATSTGEEEFRATQIGQREQPDLSNLTIHDAIAVPDEKTGKYNLFNIETQEPLFPGVDFDSDYKAHRAFADALNANKKDTNVQQDESLPAPFSRSQLQDSQVRDGAKANAEQFGDTGANAETKRALGDDRSIPDRRGSGINESNTELKYEPTQELEQTRTPQQDTQGEGTPAAFIDELGAQKTISAEPIATAGRVVEGLINEQTKATNIDTTIPQERTGTPTTINDAGQGAGAKQGKEKVALEIPELQEKFAQDKIITGYHKKITNLSNNENQTPAIVKAHEKALAEYNKAIADKLKANAPKRQGIIGDMLQAGESVLTSSGRETTPFPKFTTSTGKTTQKHVNEVDKWLMQNALDEAEARGDEFNALQFRANKDKPHQADKDSAEEYLFGEQLEVPKPFFKSLLPEKKVEQSSTQQNEDEKETAGTEAKPIDKDAELLFRSYKENNEKSANELFKKIVTDNNLKLWEQDALLNKFKSLVDNDKTQQSPNTCHLLSDRAINKLHLAGIK